MLCAALVSAASLFFTDPMPLEMPSASGYLVKSNGVMRLEDRYVALDLWTSQTVVGRWADRAGRVFTLARLDYAPPRFENAEYTRAYHAASRGRIAPDDAAARDAAVAKLTPFDMPDEPETPHVGINGWQILYYQGADDAGIACAFLPKGRRTWYFAVWELVEGDDAAAARERFEEEILGNWDAVVEEFLPSELAAAKAERKSAGGGGTKKSGPPPGERELLRADVRHAVANYPRWRTTDGREFSVIDDLGEMSGFVTAFTNDLTQMRVRYAQAFPSPLDATNTLCVARIFRDRDEYDIALGVDGLHDMKWSGAYWCPGRREIVAYLPPAGEKELLSVLRHEAFHQYLSYACSMITPSPWLNEGYAQYFEGRNDPVFGPGEDIEALAEGVRALLALDHEGFYAGTSEERELKYRLARSIAVFLEKGAPEIAREPFKDLKADYVKALLKTRDMHLATAEAFGTKDRVDLFVAEWTRFWRNR